MKSFTMIKDDETVAYHIFNDYIEAITPDGTTRMGKPTGKNDNQIIMELMNHLIEQECIIANMNIV